MRRIACFMHFFLGAVELSFEFAFRPLGLENRHRGFILIPWGALSGSQKVADLLICCRFVGEFWKLVGDLLETLWIFVRELLENCYLLRLVMIAFVKKVVINHLALLSR